MFCAVAVWPATKSSDPEIQKAGFAGCLMIFLFVCITRSANNANQWQTYKKNHDLICHPKKQALFALLQNRITIKGT